jgi:hypothetical protein
MSALSRKGIVQNCYIVENLDEAVDHWVDVFGAGPFYVERHLRVPVEYRGTPSELDIHVALGQAGDLQIELIEIASDIPSVYRDVYPNGGAGFHHVAVFVDDFQGEIDALIAKGAEMGAIGQFGGAGFAYIDTRSTVGFFTELYEESEGMRRFYRNIAAGAVDWDGKDRQRPLADVAP